MMVSARGAVSFRWKIHSDVRAHQLLAALCCVVTLPLVTAQQTRSVPSDDAVRHANRMAQGIELFKQAVRPLLVERCLPCHGGGQTLGSFDLSGRDSLVSSDKIGETAATSRLLKLIRHEQEPHMPFQQAKLPDEAIDKIARWVDLGAPYDEPLVDKPAAADGPLEITDEHREFWSFRPLASRAPPPVRDEDWPRTPIDLFILEKLDSEGLTPNPAADRRTLIRRVYLDLLGLPPASDEVDDFVSDPSPTAYEDLVDRLLESPRYGERWARHWMDIARFAESQGFEEDHDRPYAYHYRDFLIRALNQNMPYDQFIRWQLAGDELAPGKPLALMATGFLGAGPFPTQITEHEFETVRYDELDDMISTMGTAMLGLTIGCARCHDHKYDPVPTRDYYRLASTFGRTIRTEIDYDPDPQGYRLSKANWEKQHQTLVAARTRYEREHLAKPFHQWMQDGAPNAAERDGVSTANPWQVLDLTSYESKNGASFENLPDGSILAVGENPEFDDYTLTADVHTTGITALRVEALSDHSLPSSGPGRSHSGQFHLGIVSVQVQPLVDPEREPIDAKLASSWATNELDPGTSAQAALDSGSSKTGWSLSPEATGKDHAIAFEFLEPIEFNGGTRLTVTLRFSYNSQYTLGRPRLSVSTAKQPSLAVGSGTPQAVVEGLAALKRERPGSVSETQRAALLRWFARTDSRWRRMDEAVQAHAAAKPLSSKTKLQVTAEGFPKLRHNANDKGYPHFYEKTYFLNRGDAGQKQEPAESGYLQVLMRGGSDETHWLASLAGAPVPAGHALQSPKPGWGKSTSRRASLANWLTDVDQGAGALLARVIVNRLWHHHFGRGTSLSSERNSFPR